MVVLERTKGLLMSWGAVLEEPRVANEPVVVAEKPGLLIGWGWLCWRRARGR